MGERARSCFVVLAVLFFPGGGKGEMLILVF